MPKTQDIIAGLHSIANEYTAFAILWHVVFYLLLALLIFKWEPSNRFLGILLFLPLLSVAVFAWISGNPFNGSIFTLMAIFIFIFGIRTSTETISLSPFPYYLIGIVMIIFGLVYPHFVNADSFIKYLYASPVGLIPCPTLSILIGFILLFNGFGSQSLTVTFIVFGLFYGIFGILKLAVYLDIFLLIGTLSLLIKYLTTVKNPVA